MFEVETDEAGLIDEIARLERVKSAAAAGQARLTAVLAEKRRTAEAERRCAAGQAMPWAGQRGGVGATRLPGARRQASGFATALVFEMPHTLAALECGALSEWRATLIVRESACLDRGGPTDAGRRDVRRRHRPRREG